jgi:hypothetical protein
MVGSHCVGDGLIMPEFILTVGQSLMAASCLQTPKKALLGLRVDMLARPHDATLPVRTEKKSIINIKYEHKHSFQIYFGNMLPTKPNPAHP